MSSYGSRNLKIVGETYGEGKRVEVDVADNLLDGDVRLDLFLEELQLGDYSSVVLTREAADALGRALLDRHHPHRRYQGPREVDAATPFAAGMAGSNAAGAKWSDDERDAVDRAIRRAAASCRTFTADDVWAELPRDFPVTKGLAGRLVAAANAGAIRRTGDTVVSERTGAHGHGQRLGVWRRVDPHLPAAGV